MQKVIAVIPARAGSKGIPRKNMRLMHGKPLIGYAIENAIDCSHIDSVVVTTDSEDIAGFAKQYPGVHVIRRPDDLAGDSVTLDPVVYDAVVKQEDSTGVRYDIVVTLQPTSPLLSAATLNAAIHDFLESDDDTMISVVNQPHLNWIEGDNGKAVPGYSERKNRQELPADYKETGAFLISRRDHITSKTRIGRNVVVYEVPPQESIDIDDLCDWAACESVLGKKRIVFRADGFRQLGMGHIYRGLTLAYALTGHDIVFICSKEHPEGSTMLKRANMAVIEIESEEALVSVLNDLKADIYVSDQLDTTREYIDAIKEIVPRVVSFEDLGTGSTHADAVINALYKPDPSLPPSFFCGEKYVCLRDEFLIAEPGSFHEEARRVFVMFGGADPLDLTSRIYKLAKEVNEHEINQTFDFVLGLPYSNDGIVSVPERGIFVHRDISRVSDIMNGSDLAFTSQGRSVFELASLGIPSIVLAQNDREMTHYFAQMNNGFINLGAGWLVDDGDIKRTFDWLVRSPGIRREMRNLMLSKDLKSGIARIKRIILGEDY